MRLRLSLLVTASCLGLATMASAVPLDPGGQVGIVAQQRTPNSLQFDLYLFSAPGIELGHFVLIVDGFETFAFAPRVPNVSYADSTWVPNFLGDGRGVLAVVNEIQIIGGATVVFPPIGGSDDLDGVLLGTLVSRSSELTSVELDIHDELIGGSPIWDTAGNPIPVEQIVVRVVPEPAPLLALSIVSMLLARRLRPAQHRSR